jgi:hypothetical protein
MSDVFTVPLKHRIAGEANIEILRAEMLAGVRSPLALIRYAEQGREVEFGLRLDIDKKVFLDHLLDDRQERLLTRIAPDVAAILGRELRNIRQRGTLENNVSNSAVQRGVIAGAMIGGVAGAVLGGVATHAVIGGSGLAGSASAVEVSGVTETAYSGLGRYSTDRAETYQESSIPGVQTGGHAVDSSGATDPHGIIEKAADTVTGNHVDDKTGRPV